MDSTIISVERADADDVGMMNHNNTPAESKAKVEHSVQTDLHENTYKVSLKISQRNYTT